jgi:hypothetical protein
LKLSGNKIVFQPLEITTTVVCQTSSVTLPTHVV